MVNYWKFQSPFHVEERSTKGEGMQTYSDMLQRRAILDWNEQKAAIVEHTSTSNALTGYIALILLLLIVNLF